MAREPQGLCVVFQIDHQTQCAAAAGQWGNDTFTRIDHWESLEVAVATHDAGWAAWEAAPEVDDEGHPVDFPDLDRARHVQLARAGVDAAVRRGPRVGLLVSMHCEGLYRSRLGLDGPHRPLSTLPGVVQAFIAEQAPIQQVARAEIGNDESEGEGVEAWAWAAYRLIQAWDSLSLFLTWRGLPAGRDWRLPAVPRRVGDQGVDLVLRRMDDRTARCRPFPFVGDSALLPVNARVIPDRTYRSHDDLRAALQDAEVERREYRVVPG